MVHEFVLHPVQREGVQTAVQASPEIDRLLTAAVVNRRFCRLLLTNPLAALTSGYRGEAFRLQPTEVKRISAIHATSLRDFAQQLLVNVEAEQLTKTAYTQEHQGVAIFA